jgi:hypothetical protein
MEHSASRTQLCKLELQALVTRLGKVVVSTALHTSAVPSLDAVAIFEPSGDHATEKT